MKKSILLILLVLPVLLSAQYTHKERIEKKLSFETSQSEKHLLVRNISGGIEVMGYDGQDVVLEVVKTLEAKTEGELNRAKKEIKLGIAQQDNVILLYMDSPCTDINLNKVKLDPNGKSWDLWKNNCNWENDAEFKFDFTLKVPRQLHLSVSTVNEGDISIQNVKGELKVNNVNGHITLDQIENTTKARTVNGDVIIHYRKNPVDDCSYYTLNGDIKANFLQGLAAEVYFKSFNGEFFTNLEDLEPFVPKLEKEKSSKSTKYQWKPGLPNRWRWF